MKIRNTSGILEYIFISVWSAAMACISYSAFLLRRLGDLSYDQSRNVLYILVAACVCVGTMITSLHNRNGMSAFANVVFPFGIFTVIAYYSIEQNVIIITLSVCLAACFLCIALFVLQRFKNKNGTQLSVLKCTAQIFYNIYYIFAIGLFIITLHFGGGAAFGENIIQPTVSAIEVSKADERSDTDDMEVILKLEENTWRTLTVQQRVDILQTIANMEHEYLGIPHEVHVGAANLGEHTLGTYNDAKYMIRISLDSLEHDPAKEVLNSLLHEIHHSFSNTLVEMWQGVSSEYQNLKLFDRIKEYAAEYQDYQNPNDGDPLSSYYEQKCEEDAREYAQQRSQEIYYSKINEYLGVSVDDSLVEYDENGNAFLLNADTRKRIAGPYKYIDEPFAWKWNKVIRYIGENGLWGYLNSDGAEITPPIYLQASYMEGDTALVSEEQGNVYYIDSEGKRITKNYMDAHPSFEHEGCFARVKLDDGKWGIINRQDEIVFSGADSITELPDVTTIGSAVVNGQAVLFQLSALDIAENEFTITKTFDDFTDISYVYMGDFAIVKNKSGRYGVVNWKGEPVVQDKYYSIQYDTIGAIGSEETHVVFQLQNADGTYEVVKTVF